jgi:hypothetical protein
MGLRERFGCFFLIGGLAVFLLYAIPLWNAFRDQPDAVPADWIVIALCGAGAVWIGWRLYAGGRAASRKPPSLGTRLYARWRADADPDSPPEDPDDRRG